MPRRDLSLVEQENVRVLMRVLHVRLGSWTSVERALPVSPRPTRQRDVRALRGQRDVRVPRRQGAGRVAAPRAHRDGTTARDVQALRAVERVSAGGAPTMASPSRRDLARWYTRAMEWMLEFILPSAFWMAVFAALAFFGWQLKKHSPDPDGSDAAPHVPAACVVTTERTYRFPPVASPPVAWGRIIGDILLVIGVGACVLTPVVIFLAVLGAGC
jgi:hypothetical protein